MMARYLALQQQALAELGERAWIGAYIATRHAWLAGNRRSDLRATTYRMEAFQRLAEHIAPQWAQGTCTVSAAVFIRCTWRRRRAFQCLALAGVFFTPAITISKIYQTASNRTCGH